MNTTATGSGPRSPRATADVLWEEFRALRPESAAEGDTLKDYEVAASRAQLSALCLSGGGIRSAAFALGVMQALARKELLASFDYVSTVSGGGYVGGFLQRWIVAERSKDGEPLPPLGEKDVEQALRDGLSGDEPVEITRLREGANFITPRVGTMSVDTWTALATTIRNLFVNWTMFLPLFLIVAGIPQVVYWFLSPLPAWGAILGMALEFGGLTFAMSVVARSLPSYRSGDEPRAGLIMLGIVPFIGIAAAGAMMILAADPSLGWSEDERFLPAAGAFVAATLAAFAIVFAWSFFTDKIRRGPMLRDLVRWLLCSAAAAAVLYWAARPLAGYFTFTKTSVEHLEWLVAFGPVAFIVSILVSGWVFSAIRSLWLDTAKFKPDLDREWLVRLSAILMKPAFVWMVGVLLTLVSVLHLGPALGEDSLSLSAWFGTGGALSGVVAAFAGKSGSTAMGYARKFLSLETIIVLAVILFVVLTMLAAGLFEAWLALQASTWLCGPSCPPGALWYQFGGHSIVVGALLLWVVGLGYVFNVNRFSLNGFYRNRLARAFLGAARAGTRSPDPLTGFDARDNIRMHSLWPRPPGPGAILDAEADGSPAEQPDIVRSSLFPVVNIALNVTATARLAWQERKAEPFIVTPFACGSAMLDSEEGQTEPRGAYVPATEYSGKEGDRTLAGGGITLADAVSISGAAVSPAMGYHSSAATAFLMTLFNVRLGAWLPNPIGWRGLGRRDPILRKTNALIPFLAELGGATDDRTHDVYLSDGGHFENLGLYEMIRRRCRYIFISDGGCDPAFDFTDLGNAIRKVSIDLRTDIVFSEVKLGARTTPVAGKLAYAVATINYPAVNGVTPEPGTLIYLKPSVLESLPMDVNAYAIANLAFPHESTADQWYSESQFESYRRLGQFLTDNLTDKTFGSYTSGKDRIHAFFDVFSPRKGSAGQVQTT